MFIPEIDTGKSYLFDNWLFWAWDNDIDDYRRHSGFVFAPTIDLARIGMCAKYKIHKHQLASAPYGIYEERPYKGTDDILQDAEGQ